MKKIAIKYGLWMLAGFIAFFLIMHLIGLSTKTWLRIFNGVIHIGLLWTAIREYRQSNPEAAENYVSSVAVGMWTSAIGVVGFSIFMFFFMVLNEPFMQAVQDNIPIGKYINPFTATLFILAEGIAISLIGSYILIRIVDMRLSDSSSTYSD